jgi:hypothetical protein
MCLPEHSLQLDRTRPWQQMHEPPQSLHRYFCRPWLQMELPPQSLHRDFSFPWLQNDGPQQSLHCDFCFPWLQIDTPTQSLHFHLSLPWSQIETPPQSLHRDFILPWQQRGRLFHLLSFAVGTAGNPLRVSAIFCDIFSPSPSCRFSEKSAISRAVLLCRRNVLTCVSSIDIFASPVMFAAVACRSV